MSNKDSKVIGRECKFAIHLKARKGVPDYHMVKEVLHHEDGSHSRKISWIKDFKRDFYITAPQYRAEHKQKKEAEVLEKLMRYECTQSDLKDRLAEVLGERDPRKSIKELCNSPYVYGTEVSSTSLIKAKYAHTWPDAKTSEIVATLDIETDTLSSRDKVGDPIMATIVMEGKIYTAVTKDFVKRYSDPIAAIESRTEKYIGKYIKGGYQYDKEFQGAKYDTEVVLADNAVDVIVKVFEELHKWQPDILGIWNMNFDIPEILNCLKKYNVEPTKVLCDPKVPMPLRRCYYRPGQSKKPKANGDQVPIPFSEQWHTLVVTASFYVLDAMCVHRLLRLHLPKLPSYKLDSILDKVLGIRKLDFSEADGLKGLDWHIFLQKNYPAEYVVYNQFDSLSMFELDRKTNDLRSTITISAAFTDFVRFKSLPTRIVDDLHFFLLERGSVIGSVGSEDVMYDYVIEPDDQDGVDDIDKEVLGLRGWIITLPAHLVVLVHSLIKEDPNIKSLIRMFVYDSDCISAYPTCISILNISKATTKRELISIDGIEEEIFRMQNMNLVCGNVNAVEYSSTMFNLPTLKRMEELYDSL